MVPHVHGELCDFATNPKYGRFRSAEMPRSWFKTWVWTVGKSIWMTLPDEENLYIDSYPDKGPNCRVLIASNVIDNAARMINKIKREWESNSRLRAAFPELIPDFNKTRWSDHCAEVRRTIKAQEGTYTAVGVGGSVISQHFDHILEDDLIYAKKDDFSGQELMPGQEEIDNAIGWHKLTFSLLSNPQTSTMDNIGTRWAPHDLIDYIRNREEKYNCFRIRVTKDGVWPARDDNDCVWPERYDKVTLESIRDSQGPQIFETQYLGRPRVGQDITFDVSYLREHETLEDYPNLTWITIVDLASWKDKKRICNNVILTGAKDSRNHFYVARVDAGHYNPTQVIDLIAEHNRQFDSKVYVEEVGYQVALAHFAKKQMETEGATHYDIGALPTDNRSGAKDLRIQSVQPVVKNGALHILKSMKQLRSEMEDYPYTATKDILDILGWLIRLARSPSNVAKQETDNPFSLESIIKGIESRRSLDSNMYEAQAPSPVYFKEYNA